MRINARLDDERQRKLAEIGRRTGQGITEIVKEAIDLYYARVAEEPVRARAVLEASGFIGCASGEEDLSETYKQVLTRELAGKHGPG